MVLRPSIFLLSNNDTRNDVSGEQKIIKNLYSVLCNLIAPVMALQSHILTPWNSIQFNRSLEHAWIQKNRISLANSVSAGYEKTKYSALYTYDYERLLRDSSVGKVNGYSLFMPVLSRERTHVFLFNFRVCRDHVTGLRNFTPSSSFCGGVVSGPRRWTVKLVRFRGYECVNV
jgi:hypothetical protein